MIVHVVAYDSIDGVSGHDWYYGETTARKEFERKQADPDYRDDLIYTFTAEVPGIESGDEVLGYNAITKMIDGLIWQHGADELHNQHFNLTGFGGKTA